MNQFAKRNFHTAAKVFSKAVATKDEVTARKYLGLMIGMVINLTDNGSAVTHFSDLFTKDLDTLPLAMVEREFKGLNAVFGQCVHSGGRR